VCNVSISFKFPARSEQIEHFFLSRTLDRASYQSYCPNISYKMAGLAETWSNIEVLSVIRFLRIKGTSPAKIHDQRVEVYGANVMSRKHVWVWCTATDNSRTGVQDEQRSGRPSTSTADDNVCRIEGLIQENRRILLCNIADELNISIGTVHNIVREQLRYRKVCSRWVPKQFTEVHKSTALQFGGTGPSSLQP
jgi:hypothetical protein